MLLMKLNRIYENSEDMLHDILILNGREIVMYKLANKLKTI